MFWWLKLVHGNYYGQSKEAKYDLLNDFTYI